MNDNDSNDNNDDNDDDDAIITIISLRTDPRCYTVDEKPIFFFFIHDRKIENTILDLPNQGISRFQNQVSSRHRSAPPRAVNQPNDQSYNDGDHDDNIIIIFDVYIDKHVNHNDIVTWNLRKEHAPRKEHFTDANNNATFKKWYANNNATSKRW